MNGEINVPEHLHAEIGSLIYQNPVALMHVIVLANAFHEVGNSRAAVELSALALEALRGQNMCNCEACEDAIGSILSILSEAN